MDNCYGEYIDKWLSGIYAEILFWKEYIEERGGIYTNEYGRITQKDAGFVLEEDIPDEKKGMIYQFADVGSGPFSNCGFVSGKVKLNMVAIDPLAEVYKLLKEKNNLDNDVLLQTGFVEALDSQYPENSFDMVHMSNSLDHSFDVIMGIYQLLYICKIGGKVILRHAENEAENEGYQGFHQWNLSLKNPENSFIVWREGTRIDVPEIFQEYADIELYCGKGECPFNKVVFTKRKPVKIPDNKYREILFTKVYSFLIRNMMSQISMENGRKNLKTEIAQEINKINASPAGFRGQLKDRNIKDVAIYGMGIIGEQIYDLLIGNGIQVNAIIDVRKITKNGIRSIPLEEYADTDKVSVIIVCIAGDADEVIDQMVRCGINEDKIVKAIDFVKGGY